MAVLEGFPVNRRNSAPLVCVDISGAAFIIRSVFTAFTDHGDWQMKGIIFFCIKNTFLGKYNLHYSAFKDFKSFTVLPAEIYHAVCYINLCCAYTHLCHRQTHAFTSVPQVDKQAHSLDIYVHMSSHMFMSTQTIGGFDLCIDSSSCGVCVLPVCLCYLCTSTHTHSHTGCSSIRSSVCQSVLWKQMNAVFQAAAGWQNQPFLH